MAQKHILIICGEASGDLNAAGLAKKILEINPEIKISAVGGQSLRNTKAKIFYDIKELSAIGFFDAIIKLPKFFALRKIILHKIKEENIDAVILIDFSGFNLRLAKKINKAIPVIYYIGPQVWASRPGRIKTIKKYIDKVIVIFKFEGEFYKQHGVDADFVGHPLLDIVKPTMEKKEFLNKFNLSDSKTTIALLPGSRRTEIENILPIMLKASVLINRGVKEAQFVIAKAPLVDWDIYNRKIRGFDLDLKVIEGKTYDCLNIADFCLVCSGTATLETAIIEKPFVVIYKMGLLNYLLYRPQVKVPYIGMVNIVAQRKIIPEYIQYNAKPEKIAAYIKDILTNPEELARIKRFLSEVKNRLGEKDASLKAAQIILEFLNKNENRPY
jgi:lipid-A-disaccharide synthase